jgi:hypothetical protein
MVDGTLIGMRELVYGEGVLIDPPGPVHDVIPEGRRGRTVDLLPSLYRVGVTGQANADARRPMPTSG